MPPPRSALHPSIRACCTSSELISPGNTISAVSTTISAARPVLQYPWRPYPAVPYCSISRVSRTIAGFA
eukprot:1907703-Rhodomonas_salina.1